MELTSRFYKIDNQSRRCVEAKEDYKKRGFKSPDYADACLLCFYNRQGGSFDDIDNEPGEKPMMAGILNKQF
jgi:phage terminase large subunit